MEEHGQCPATSLMVVKVMAGNLDVLSPQTASELDRLVSLKTDECVYAYANYLLKTVLFRSDSFFCLAFPFLGGPSCIYFI